jgi:hypothetical protein
MDRRGGAKVAEALAQTFKRLPCRRGRRDLKRAKLRAMLDAEVIGAAAMGVHKQLVSFSEDAYAFAKELVESGEYPTVSDAVSGELERAKELRAWR